MQSRTLRPGIAVSWDRLIPSWPLIVGLAALARALLEPSALLHDPDTYLHIAAGQWMIGHHALPVADPFSHSMAGAPWPAPEWLAEIIFAAVYGLLGWGGVVALAAISFASGLALLARFLLRRVDSLTTLVAVFGGMALLLPHLLARPHILALPLLVLWCGVLFWARDDGRGPPLVLLPVMVLWANLHGSFLFGLGLAGLLGIEALLTPGEGRSRGTEILEWGRFGAGAIIASFCTPNGTAGLVEPLQLILMPALQGAFGEWLPPNLAAFPALELWLLGALALGFGTGARLEPVRLLILLGVAHMALAHARHADLLALVAPLALAGPLAAPLARLLGAPDGSILLRGVARLAGPAALPAIALCGALGVILVSPLLANPPARNDDLATPTSAVAAAKRLGLTGPVFNSEHFGGYLVFSGVPTFIDGRVEMYGNDFLARDHAAERGDGSALPEVLNRYGIQWTLLLPHSGAVDVLDHLPGWRRVYADDIAVIHARADTSPQTAAH